MVGQMWIMDVPAEHVGQVAAPANADQSYQSQQWPGLIAGAVAGILLGSSIFAAHPIIWGVIVFIGGGMYAASHLFECNDMQTDPAAMAACSRQGFIEVMPIGAALGLVLYGLFG